MEFISRKEAKFKGLKRYFTGKPCLRGHITERGVCNKNCLKCQNERAEKFRQNNLDKFAAKKRKWNKNNPEKLSINNKKFQKENPDKCNAYNRKYQISKFQRIPSWVDFDKIKEFYTEAARKTKETGIKYVVDHIIPLQGKNVSGLHVENNLQVITKKENCEKNNRFVI